jgi:hypothetical protein
MEEHTNPRRSWRKLKICQQRDSHKEISQRRKLSNNSVMRLQKLNI